MEPRPAGPADIEILRAVEVEAGEPFRALGMDRVADDPPPSAVVLGGFVDRGEAWVLEEDGRVVAYRLDAAVDGLAHLEQVSVRPSHARRGLGRLLVSHLVDLARAAGLPAVTLTTYTEVPWNGPYYRRLGFRELAADDLGPGLRAIRRTEIARGLDRWPRCAMRRDL